MEQSLGFAHFLAQTDALARLVLVLLLALSIASWYLIVSKGLSNYRAGRRAALFLKQFWAADSPQEVCAALQQPQADCAFAKLAKEALEATSDSEKHGMQKLAVAGGLGEFLTRLLRNGIDQNVVPLVDVMLVLLVIFIITAPLLTHSVKIDLPKAGSAPNITQPAHIEFGIRANGTLYWNGAPVTLPELPARFAAEAAKQPQPELHIRADRQATYEIVAQVMSTAASAGLVRIGFVTEPARR